MRKRCKIPASLVPLVLLGLAVSWQETHVVGTTTAAVIFSEDAGDPDEPTGMGTSGSTGNPNYSYDSGAGRHSGSQVQVRNTEVTGNTASGKSTLNNLTLRPGQSPIERMFSTLLRYYLTRERR